MEWNSKAFISFFRRRTGNADRVSPKSGGHAGDGSDRGRDWFGRPMSNRKALGRAFVAKAVSNAPGARNFRGQILGDSTLRRMCGWEEKYHVPSEATFSRAFGEFAKSALAERAHKELLKRTLSDHLFGHISQDSTSIEGREKPVKKPKQEPKPKNKRGRPRKGEEQLPEQTFIERQMTMTVEEISAELSTVCDRGTKRNSKGYMITWNGFKLPYRYRGWRYTHFLFFDFGLGA